jgi:GGDEF domain-containing protein
MSEHDQGLGREEVLGHPALTDPRTGLANRLHFELVYRYLFTAGDRGIAFTLILLSVGGPDRAEDDKGWLRMAGETLHRTTRTSDLVAYVDGNRFAVLLLGTNLSGARVAADRIERVMRSDGSGRIAIGLAAFDPTLSDSVALLRSVESALAVAERAGGGVEMA